MERSEAVVCGAETGQPVLIGARVVVDNSLFGVVDRVDTCGGDIYVILDTTVEDTNHAKEALPYSPERVERAGV